MILSELLDGIPVIQTLGVTNGWVGGVFADSRKVGKGSVFVAVRGTLTDGHSYIPKAVERGALAVVCEVLPAERAEGVCYVQVSDSSRALAAIACAYYGHPSGKLKLVGVTGTNGKTTTVTLLYRLFTGLGYKCGLLSTVENRVGNQVLESTHTTPDALSLNALLHDMADAGCTYVFMEVSSHALHQNRVHGIRFEGGVFTNITHDHLDYHQTFDAYIRAKKLFFDNLQPGAFALVNTDDKRGEVMLQNTRATRYTYALRRDAQFKARILENHLSGLFLQVNGTDFHARLIGTFNAYNLLAVYAVGVLLHVPPMEVLQVLSNIEAPEGRFEYVAHIERNIMGIVDYAHTPDALEKVLDTINDLRSGNGQVITVVGCGGDRDKTKRPIMAKVACDKSDKVILTSDNPRTENPEQIIHDMEAGVPASAARKVLSITNREQAIKTAVQLAHANDIILVAGKGHERYQEIHGIKHPFDDKTILQTALHTLT